MKLHKLVQGSDEWLAHRAGTYNASDASAMMGASPYRSRNDLMDSMKTGLRTEVTPDQQALFNRGHEAEALGRPVAEELVGEELYPAIVTADDQHGLSRPLGASLDGMTMDGQTIFEHKLFNAGKAACIERGECPSADVYQVQQQLLVTGAARCLYMLSDIQRGRDPVYLWVESDPQAQAAIIAGWQQLETDLASHEPQATIEAVGSPMESLPALHIEVEGQVVASNIDAYRDHAIAVFESINTDLQTDQDFADAAEVVKWCKAIEDRIKAAKGHALGQTASIDELFRAMDDVSESARQKRLELDRLVKARKVSIRNEIAAAAAAELSIHIGRLDERIDGMMPDVPADFHEAMKGKRTVKSLHDAVDQELAGAKIRASAIADQIDANLRHYMRTAEDRSSLFPDLRDLVTKAADDFAAVVALRIQQDDQRQAELMAEAERRALEQAEQQKAAEPVQAESQPIPQPEPEKAPSADAAKPEPAKRTVLTIAIDLPSVNVGALLAALAAAGFPAELIDGQ